MLAGPSQVVQDYPQSVFTKDGQYRFTVTANTLNETSAKDFNFFIEGTPSSGPSKGPGIPSTGKPAPTINCPSNTAVICYGTKYPDHINGTMMDDIINGQGGNDSIFGANGDDIINGQGGNDSIFGANGSDTLIGGQGDDQLSGDINDDVLLGNEGSDTLIGGQGDDQLSGDINDDVLLGNEGSDTLVGGLGADVIKGGNGNDTIFQGPNINMEAISGDGKVDIIDCGGGYDTVFLNIHEGDRAINCELIFSESISTKR